ncbi:sel1 repeat family protein [Amphritea spongicola]|nr:sel1 repeat family protein [Aliamphritea spongicola]
MRLVMKLIAPLLGWLAFAAFRSSLLKSSRAKHQLVMKLFRKAADNGSTKALSVYGHLLHYRGEDETNRIQGAIYLRRAAEQGDAKAAYQIARLFEQGYPVIGEDADKALKFYRQAGEKGHVLAIKRLIEVYESGGLHQLADPGQLAFWKAQQARFGG